MTFDVKEFAAKVRVLDGAWGTQLQAAGLPSGCPPELWNVENPSAVEAVARSYVEAGSEVILTNTFGGNRFVLARHGLAKRTAELVEAGVAISRRAAGDRAKVFASVGPTGLVVMLEESPAAELEAAFAEAAVACARGGADAIVLETFSEAVEIVLALKAVKQACDLPVVCSMTFSSGRDRTSTAMGTTPRELAAATEAAGADAVGANCGIGPDNYVRVAAMLRAATCLPIWVKANAGMPQLAPGGRVVFPMGPEEFAASVPALIAAGAAFIGGCCGTTPDHIRAVRRAVDSAAAN